MRRERCCASFSITRTLRHGLEPRTATVQSQRRASRKPTTLQTNKAYYAADKSSDQQSDEGLLLNGIGNDGRSFTHLVSSLAIGLLCRHGRLACPSLPPHSPPFAVMSEAQTGAPPLLERTFSPAMGHPAARPARLHWAQAGLSAFRHPDGKPRCPRDWCGQNSFPKRVHVGLHRLATL